MEEWKNIVKYRKDSHITLVTFFLPGSPQLIAILLTLLFEHGKKKKYAISY